MKVSHFPPIPEPLRSALSDRVHAIVSGERNTEAAVMVLGGNYRGLFGQLAHRLPFDDVARRDVRVVRLPVSAEQPPDGLPIEVAEHVGFLTSCGSELLGLASASVYFQAFVSSAHAVMKIYRWLRARTPTFDKDPAGYVSDLLHAATGDGPCILLIESIDDGSRHSLLNLALYEHRSRPNPRRLVICGVDDLAAGATQPPEWLAPVFAAAGPSAMPEWLSVPVLDARRTREWLSSVDADVVDAVLAHSGGGYDDSAASVWNDWVDEGYVNRVDGRWQFTGRPEPTERRIATVLAARLSQHHELPVNSMNVARSTLGIAAIGGMSFPEEIVAQVTAEFEGCPADTVIDIVDSLLPTDTGAPALVVSDGYVEPFWLYRFVESSLPTAFAAGFDLPVDLVAESLVKAGADARFPSAFNDFFARVAARAGNDALARELRERQRVVARHRALVEEGEVVLHTAGVLAHDPARTVRLANDLHLLGERVLAVGVARVAHRLAEGSDDRTRAFANLTLGVCLMDSEPQESERHLATAVDLYEGLHASDPANLTAARDLAIGLGELGWVVKDRDPGKGEELSGRALTLHEGVHASDPANLTVTRDLAIGLGELGWVVMDRDPGKGERLLGRSVELFEGLHASDPANLAAARDLAIGLSDLGWVVKGRDPGEGERLLGRSVELFEGLHASDPENLAWARVLAITLMTLGWVVKGRDPGEGERLLGRSVDLHEGLHASDPENLVWTRDLAIALHELGWVVKDRDPEEADRLERRAAELRARFNPSPVPCADGEGADSD